MSAAPTNSTDLIVLLRKSGLVEPARLDAWLRDNPPADDPKGLALHMVRSSLITRFHAKWLLGGRYKGFVYGQYRLLEQIGSGGSGIVFLAEHLSLQRKVAIKVLPAENTFDGVLVERFYREARVVASLDHPNIVRAYDASHCEDKHYLVMEYIEGETLQQVVKQKGPLPPNEAANYISQAAQGLEHAHRRSIVHRDIKPSNLLVDKQGVVKILDMGLARFFDHRQDDLTTNFSKGVVVGTADYMAPEQAMDFSDVDGRTDIYSLGATFYMLLSGSPPFQGDPLTAKLIAHQVKEPTAITTLRADVPAGMAEVLAKMMAKKPEDRYGSPAAVVEALSQWSNAPPSSEPTHHPRKDAANLSDTMTTASPKTKTSKTLPPPATGSKTSAHTPPAAKSMAPESGRRQSTRPRATMRWVIPVVVILTGGVIGLLCALPGRSKPSPASSEIAAAAAPAPGQSVAKKPAVRSQQVAEKIEFNTHIRPILAENCFACHGPDSGSRQAGLRLDQRDLAIKKGAIIPGKPEQSALVSHIFATKPDGVMPPPRTNKALAPTQKEILKQWIAQGAEYQPLWSLIPPKKPVLPTVGNTSWVRNPIDQFVLAELEKRDLQPAPEADRRTLARRLSLDLTGLPPAPEEVEAFVNDTAADWYEKYVDKQLRSRHWGEHRGRYWLDAARYADTHGLHVDNFREIWTFRDWVINAFNQNMKFDQFTIEQLAGDLLPDPSIDQRIATGFNRCNITTNEGGAIDEEYLVLYARDRTETVSQVWLGTTLGCAACHDHKFDPFSMRDFYALSAFFNNTTQKAMDGNVRNTPPVITLFQTDDPPRSAAIVKEMEQVRNKLKARRQECRGDFDEWLKNAKPESVPGQTPNPRLKFHAKLSEGEGNSISYLFDGKTKKLNLETEIGWTEGKIAPKAFTQNAGTTIAFSEVGDFERDDSFTIAVWVRFEKINQVGSMVARLDVNEMHRGWDFCFEDGQLTMAMVGRFPEKFFKAVSEKKLEPNTWYHAAMCYDGSSKADGVKIYIDGAAQIVTESLSVGKILDETVKVTVPLKLGERSTGTRIQSMMMQDLRIYDTVLTAAQVEQLATPNRATDPAPKPIAERTPKETEELIDRWLASVDKTSQELEAKLKALEREQASLKTSGSVAYVMQERDGEAKAHILDRGEYDKRREEVKANTPQALPPFPNDVPHNRLGLAKWLLSPEQPLTTRVTVNRFWQELFGAGLVLTPGDFGVMGELPSHPELLDWLAIEFRESWDVKQFFKMMVMSATYRQAAVTTKEKLDKDPHNRWLSRGPRQRMDAEMIRDHALAASGLLVRKVGGPSVKPYQPDGVWEAVAVPSSDTRNYVRDTGEKLFRRSLYTFWKRSAPPTSMEIFNAPNRETCVVRRERTNTPLQALVTLNDPQFVEAARALAQKALKEGGVDEPARLDFIARRLLSRPLRSDELNVVQDSLAKLRAAYKDKQPEARKLIAVGELLADATIDPIELAAWTMLVNELMNLDEVLNK